jgi:hypothetical protein
VTIGGTYRRRGLQIRRSRISDSVFSVHWWSLSLRRPRCSIKLTHLRSGELILRVRRWRPGTSGWVHFIRVFLGSATTRFLRPGHTHRTAPRAAAVKTGRRPPPQAVVLTAVSMVRASTRPNPAPRGSQLAMARDTLLGQLAWQSRGLVIDLCEGCQSSFAATRWPRGLAYLRERGDLGLAGCLT